MRRGQRGSLSTCAAAVTLAQAGSRAAAAEAISEVLQLFTPAVCHSTPAPKQLLEGIIEKRQAEEAAAAELERQRREKRQAARVSPTSIPVGQHRLCLRVCCCTTFLPGLHPPTQLPCLPFPLSPHPRRTRRRLCGANR